MPPTGAHPGGIGTRQRPDHRRGPCRPARTATLRRTADWPTLIDASGHLATAQRRPTRTPPAYPGPDMKLSPRERDVLRHSLTGASVSTLARLQGLSEKTISTQKRAAYRKLGLHGDADLFRLADLVTALVDEAPVISRPHAA